nr:vegetative cell wall protein gp1-like [Aegilops tauschii subsp. strangulata]
MPWRPVLHLDFPIWSGEEEPDPAPPRAPDAGARPRRHPDAPPHRSLDCPAPPLLRRTAPFPRLCFTQRRRTSSPTSSPRLSTVPCRLRSPSTAVSRRSAPPLLLAVAAHRAPTPAPAAPITAVRTHSLWLWRPAPLPPPLATAATRCCCHLLLRSSSRCSWPPALAPARPGLRSAAAPVSPRLVALVARMSQRQTGPSPRMIKKRRFKKKN